MIDIIQCQRYARQWLASKRLKQLRNERDFRQAEAAAVTIQSAFRGYLMRSDFIITLLDIISVQSYFRQWAAMKEKRYLLESRHQAEAATKIQKSARGYLTHMRFVLAICDVITCQSVVRQWSARRVMSDKLHQRNVKIQQACATAIQARWKAYVGRNKHFMFAKIGMVQLQSLTRGMIQRRKVRMITICNSAATVIQR